MIKATQIMLSIIRKTLLTTIPHYHNITITYNTKFNARKGTNKPRNKKLDTPQAQTQLLKTIVGVRKEHQLFIHISYYPMAKNLIHIHTNFEFLMLQKSQDMNTIGKQLFILHQIT